VTTPFGQVVSNVISDVVSDALTTKK